jgi:hypothetical protein
MQLIESRVHLPDGTLEWRVTFGNHQHVAVPGGAMPVDVVMPFRVRFEQPSRGIDTLVRFESIDVGGEAPGDAFVQTPRPGLRVETVECQ